MSEREFFTYARVGKRLLSEWGWHADNITEAARIAANGNHQAACLLAYAMASVGNVVNKLLDAVACEKIRSVERQAEQEINEVIDDDEKLRGPCPSGVRRWLLREAISSAISRITWTNEIKYRGYAWSPPPKGTDLRKQYDRWMKRRVSKKKAAMP